MPDKILEKDGSKKMKNKLVFTLGFLFVFGSLFVACDNGSGSDSVGTFRIRVTGIPSDVMAAGQSGQILIGIGPANALQNDGSNALAGRYTSISAADDSFGIDWYEFSLYNIHNDQKYTNSSGNYDIGFMNNSNGSVKLIRNIRLEANATNTIGYSSFK
jgi:hypothetical protein